MWWQLVIDYPHKSFDNYHSQELAYRRAVMVDLYIDWVFPQ